MAGLFDDILDGVIGAPPALPFRIGPVPPASTPTPSPSPSPPAQPQNLFSDIVAGGAGPQAAPTPAVPKNIFDDIVPPPDLFGDIVPAAPVQAVPPVATTGDLTAEPAESYVPVRGRFVAGGSMGMQPADDLPTIADRATTAAAAANTQTLLGGAVNALTSGFYSGVSNPIDPNTGQPLPGPTPEQQAVTAEQAPVAALASEPAAQGVLGQAATVLGTGAGMAASPETLVGGGDGYAAVREGAPLIPTILRSAGIQGVASAAGNTVSQGLNTAAGEQTGGFSVPQVEQSFGTGAALGALGPAVGAVVNVARPLLDPADALFNDTVHGFAPEGTAPTLTPEAPSGLAAPAAPATPPTSGGLFDDLVPPPATAEAPTPATVSDAQTNPTAVAPAETPATAAAPVEAPVPAPVTTGGSDALPAPPTAGPSPMPAAVAPPAPEAAAQVTTGPAEAPPTQALTQDQATAGPVAPVSIEQSPSVPLAAQPQTASAPVAEAPSQAASDNPVAPPSTEPTAVAPDAPPTSAPPSTDTGTVTTATGRKVNVQYEVVPAASLTPASGDLQPRDRAGRVSSDTQVNSIAANLDPARLMRSPEADRGAPIVGPDNVIESGNGRVQAIQQAAAANPAAYARYVLALEDAGHDTTGINTPVLVARRTSALSPDDRRAFVQEANQSATQRMSAPEQANADGRAMTSDMLAKYDPTQDPASAANRPFVRDWIGTLPEAERNAVVDAQGNLSAEGARRLNGALLSKAYGDKGVLARGLESTDDATRNISGGLADAASAWAKLRAGIDAGRIPPEFDTSKHLVQAADLVRQARDKRQSMRDLLDQRDAFDAMSPETEQYVRALHNPAGTRPASRASIGDTLKRYADEASKQSTSPGLFGDTDGDAGRVTPTDALRAIVSRRDLDRAPNQGRLKYAADEHVLADRLGARPDGNFNKGTSPYRQVFIDAGRDPDEMVNRTLAVQNKVIADQLKSAFGFKDVTILPGQKPIDVRDHLSDFYNGGQEMASALGMPTRALGLNGRLSFTTKPFGRHAKMLGSYHPVTRSIVIAGRSNSFAHEMAHAIDHYLAEELAKNPKAIRLLSQTKDIGDGAIGGKPVSPNTTAEAFVNVLRAIYGKDAATAAEALKLQFVAKGTDASEAYMAELRLKEIETQFASGAKDIQGGAKGYWSDPAEMVARAHEAFVADAIERQGGDTRGVAKPDYGTAAPADTFSRLYPQGDERAPIFNALAYLYDRMRAESLLGTEAAAKRPDGLGTVDPKVWGKMVDPRDLAPGTLGNRLRREVTAQKNWVQQFKDNLGIDPKGPDAGHLGVWTRGADAARMIGFAVRSRMQIIAKRQPSPEAQAIFQRITDMIAPAEHLRSAEDAQGREVGPVYEQEARRWSRKNSAAFEAIMRDHKLLKMDDTEQLQFRHVLTTGDTKNFAAPGDHAPSAVPDNIKEAAGKTRFLLDEERRRNEAAGIGIGHHDNYFPLELDQHKVFANRKDFEAQAAKVRAIVWDKDVGNDPAKFLTAHDRMPASDRDGLSADVQAKVEALRANLRKQDSLKDGIDLGTVADPKAAQAKIDQLGAEAGAIHDQVNAPVRAAYAAGEAHRWWVNNSTGSPTDFGSTRGPTANYTHARTLPPEADSLLRDFVHTDARDVLPRYFQRSARRIAFTKRFGPEGEGLDAMFREAAEAGARPEEIAAMKRLTEIATGRLPGNISPLAERAANFIHTMGTLALMTRSAFSSLTEPVALYARGGTLKEAMSTFAHQLGHAIGTTNAKERQQISEMIGNVSSHFYDGVLADRVGASYRGDPALNKINQNFFRTIGLTALTNSQRTSMIAPVHHMLGRWSQDILSGDKVPARNAAARFRDLGIADKDHEAFADWVAARPNLPETSDLATPGGDMWGNAVTSLIDRAIQDPLSVDRPELAKNPVGRLTYGLSSFAYSYFRNVITHILDTERARVHEAYTDAREAGRGRLGSAFSAAPTAASAVKILSVFGALLIGGNYLTTALRARLMTPGEWQKHEDAGDLHEWLLNQAISRSGVNGPLGMLSDALTGLQYGHDLANLTGGPESAYFLSAAADSLKWVVGAGSPNTNTTAFYGIKGVLDMFAVPAAGVALSAIPGGPWARVAAGYVLMRYDGNDTASAIAQGLVGPKGTGVGGVPPAGSSTDPNAELATPGDPDTDPDTDPNTGQPASPQSSSGGGIPVGLWDDIAIPAAKIVMPVLKRLPVVGKVAIGAGVAAAFADHLMNEFGKFDGDGTPPN